MFLGQLLLRIGEQKETLPVIIWMIIMESNIITGNVMVVVVMCRFSGISLASGKEVASSLDDMIYLVGNVGVRGLGMFDTGSKTVLGRIKLSSILSLKLDDIASLVGRDTEEGGRWLRGASPESRLSMLDHANPELTLQYSTELRRWYSLEVDAVTAQLVLWTAKKPWGEWESSVIHSIGAPYDDLSKYR